MTRLDEIHNELESYSMKSIKMAWTEYKEVSSLGTELSRCIEIVADNLEEQGWDSDEAYEVCGLLYEELMYHADSAWDTGYGFEVLDKKYT